MSWPYSTPLLNAPSDLSTFSSTCTHTGLVVNVVVNVTNCHHSLQCTSPPFKHPGTPEDVSQNKPATKVYESVDWWQQFLWILVLNTVVNNSIGALHNLKTPTVPAPYNYKLSIYSHSMTGNSIVLMHSSSSVVTFVAEVTLKKTCLLLFIKPNNLK